MLQLFSIHKRAQNAAAPLRRACLRLALAFGGSFILLLVGTLPLHAEAQERELLNRLVQATNASDPALKAFVEGRDLIDEEKWSRAAERFQRFINEYPKDKNADAAYYYLAFAFKKQRKFRDADTTIEQLINVYPKSSWAGEGKKMRVEMAPFLDPRIAEQMKDDADVEIKIIALQSLCQSEQERCASLVNDVLRSGTRSPQRLKEAAITLLGRYGGKDAVPGLLNIIRNDPDTNLRIKAIAALGRNDDESVLEPLREQAMQPEFSDNGIVDTALHAIARHESPRAVGILGELAMNARTLEGRKHAIYLLASQRKGEPPVDELFRIYDAEQNLEIRKQVVAGLANRISERAGERLVQIARSGNNVELRTLAIRGISQRSRSIQGRDPEQDLSALLGLYDSERDDDLKNVILESISRYESKRATQKLMDVVRNSNEPVERRKRAISWLSRSKDPDVLRFLEDMLK